MLENALCILGLVETSDFSASNHPNSFGGIAAAILPFHSIGAFGVLLMVGGSIPGETKVASIAIYEAVEMMNYRTAGLIALSFIPISYAFLLLINKLSDGLAHDSIRLFQKKLRYFDVDISLECRSGKMMVLIGPSGGGKTTIIRMLAGLEKPDEGSLCFAMTSGSILCGVSM